VNYPDSAVDREIQGIRVISLSSGSWQPAMQAGRTVRSYKTQPIVFQLKVD